LTPGPHTKIIHVRLVYKRKEINTFQEQNEIDGAMTNNSEVKMGILNPIIYLI
jgi:hypothetical protein